MFSKIITSFTLFSAFVCLQSQLSGDEKKTGPGIRKGLTLSATLEGKQVRIKVKGKTFTCYKFAPDQKYPYFWPVNGPTTNKSVTTETSNPYPHHHSLFFGCDQVSGGNYWQSSNGAGQIISTTPKIINGKGSEIIIEDNCNWKRPGAPDPFSDKRKIIITAPSETIRIIDFTITLKAEIDVHINHTNHSLFSARMAPHMSVNSGGRLINSKGNLNQKDTLGIKATWCDYSGDNHGTVEGLAIMEWPKNRWAPSKWETRDYGFFSPTPMNWLDSKGMDFSKGSSITLKYRVVVHTGDEKTAAIAKLYKNWTKTVK